MKIVVGIGNPGEEYAGTRHNVGFDVVDRVASRNRVALARDRRLSSRVGAGRIGAEDVVLLEPLTYVNLSGPAVARVAREKGVELRDVLVVADDYHLPLGALRLRESGSAGGHNGLRSVLAAFGTDAFPRLRIGIGEAPPGEAEDFVLSRFRPVERKTIDEALERATECVETWLAEGSAAAMNRFNG